MRKVYELEPHFATGEATVQPVLLWGANGRPLRERFTKTSSEASEYIKAVEPRPGMSIVLLLALGAYETYDVNRNGDGFNEFPYHPGMKPLCGHPECASSDGWITQADVLPNHYQSFEQYGKVYRHHQNKDPLKACGDVFKAFWNPTMHRVELLTGVRNEVAPEIVERIADGDYPAVSMGCRIKYDVCTICGHRAPTRAKYCDHLKFGMRQVTPSGLRAGALNPSPRFFDISFVVKPADQTGYMLKKVAYEGPYEVRTSAELGEYLDRVDEKRAAIQKLSDIDKVVRGVAVDHKVSPLSEGEAQHIQKYRDMVLPAVQQMPVMDDATLNSLSEHPIQNVLSTLHAAGVILTTPEFVKLVVQKLAPGTQLDEGILDGLVASQGHVFDMFAQQPQMLDQLMQSGMLDVSAKNVDPQIGSKAEKYLEKRSTFSDYLGRALVPKSLRTEEPNWTDQLHVSDPTSGTRYVTTRGAARDAHDAIAQKQLAKMVGLGALLGGAYKLTATRIPAVMRPLALGTTLLAGSQLMRPDWGPHYMTDEGVSVPSITELHKTSGELSNVGLPVLGSAALVAALGHDYESRLRNGYPTDDPYAPLHTRMLNQLGSFYHAHPGLGFLANLGVYGLGSHMLNKVSSLMLDLAGTATDSVKLPDVDLELVAEKLGNLLVG